MKISEKVRQLEERNKELLATVDGYNKRSFWLKLPTNIIDC